MILLLKKNSGFSIAEIMVGLLILSLGLIAIANLQNKSVSWTHYSQVKTNSIFIAQKYMEDLLSKNFDDLDNEVQNQTITMDKIQYSLTTTVTTDAVTQNKNIEVKLTWGENQVVINTIRSNAAAR